MYEKQKYSARPLYLSLMWGRGLGAAKGHWKLYSQREPEMYYDYELFNLPF